MKAIGIDIHGKEIEFDCKGGGLWCRYEQLTSLTIPKGVTEVSCDYNQLTKLIIPEGVTHVYCSNNQLTELTLPEGVTYINIIENQITQMTLPDSVEWIATNKEVMGLEKYIGTDAEIELY